MSPALGFLAWSVWSAEMISSPWLFVRERSPSGNVVAVARELQRLFAVEVGGSGREVRAGEVVVHRGGDVDVDAADLVDHLLEVREVGADHPADRHADDRRHRVGLGAQIVAAPVVDDVRVELGPARALGCRAGCRDRRRPQRRVHPDHVDGVGEARDRRATAPGRRIGRRCRARARRTAVCGPPVARAAPSFVTWNHTAPAAGRGFPNSSHAAADAAGEQQSARRTGVTIRAAGRRAGGVSLRGSGRGGRRSWSSWATRPAPSRVTTMLVGGDLPGAGAVGLRATKSAWRTMCSGSPSTVVCAVRRRRPSPR